jgi:hypothetical protein
LTLFTEAQISVLNQRTEKWRFQRMTKKHPPMEAPDPEN